MRGSVGGQEFYHRRILRGHVDAGYRPADTGFSENSHVCDLGTGDTGLSENPATPDSTAAGFSEKTATAPALLEQ